MKKSIVMLVFAFATLSIVSCKDGDKKTETTEEHAGHNHAHYTCPMDCEKGKVYEEAGKCPVCEMDLTEATPPPPPPAPNDDHSEEGHEGNNH